MLRAVVCQPVKQSGVVVELLLGLRAVGAAAGGEEPVGAGRGVGGAVPSEQVDEVPSSCGGGELVRRACVGAGGVRVRAVGEEQLDEVAVTAGVDRCPDDRRRPAVVVAVAPWVGSRLEEQACTFSVAVADRGCERLLGDHAEVGLVGEKQREQLVAVVREAGEIQVVVVGDRAAVEQQLDDLSVAGTAVRDGDGAAQRPHAPASAGTPGRLAHRVRAGFEKQPGDRGQAIGAGGLELVPPR